MTYALFFTWNGSVNDTGTQQGTLTPIVKSPSMAVPSAATLEALTKLAADSKNIVWIISGRDGAFLEQHLGHIDNIGFSAEHGGFVKERGSKEWKNCTETLDMTWMNDVMEIFKYYTEVGRSQAYLATSINDEGREQLGVILK